MSDAEQRRLAILSLLRQDAQAPASNESPSHGQSGGTAVGEGAPGGKASGDGLPGEPKEQLTVLRRASRDASDNSDRSQRRLARRAQSAKQEQDLSPTDDASLRVPMARLAPAPEMPARSTLEALPPLPQRGGRRSFTTIVSFLLCVMMPTLIGAGYYIFYASNQYVSEFRFAVRELTQTTSSASAASAMGGVASLLGATSVAPNSSENYMVTEYLVSRQAVDELDEQIKVRALYSRPQIDWWSRFDASAPAEKFVSYWRGMVTADYDQITGVAVAKVRAFTSEDAYLIASTMVSLAEKLVNEISSRPRLDAVKFAEREVKHAEDRLRQIRARLSEYRDKESVIEPTSNVVTSNTTLAQSLRATLVQYQTELAALTKQNLRPNAPYIVNLKSRINAAREQLAAVEAQVATPQTGGRPLSRVVADYEQLDLERQFAQTILAGAVTQLEQARANAMSQQLYITPFVRPARAQSSTYPNRLLAILTIGLGCFFVWTIGLMVVRSIRDHLA